MFDRIPMIITTLAAITIAGCATGRAPANYEANLDPEDRASGSRATVLTGEQLRDEHGSLLDTMSRRISNLQVDNRFACPAISLRGHQNTVPGISDPLVYIDGGRALDTCILGSLNAAEVERVEIYPMGFTTRPGYAVNAHGLILVFMRDR